MASPFEQTPQQFENPQEEIEFLRKQLAERESRFEHKPSEAEREQAATDTLNAYKSAPAEEVLHPTYQTHSQERQELALNLSPEKHDETMEDLLGVLQERGLKNALSVVSEMNNPHIEDDFHRFLVQYLKETGDIPGGNKQKEMLRGINMTLFEVALPHMYGEESEQQRTFKEIVSAMEQFYAGMLSIADAKEPQIGKNYFTIELAKPAEGKEVIFFVAVPTHKQELFEKQMHAVFPDAKIEEAQDDYNIFNDEGASAGAVAVAAENPIYPIRTYDAFDHDPLNIVLNTFAKLNDTGEGAAIQLVVAPAGDRFIKKYGQALDQIREGTAVKEAINIPHSIGGEFGKALKGFAKEFSDTKKKEEGEKRMDGRNETAIEQINEKISSTILQTNIRVAASAGTERRAQDILSDLESAFHQFANTQGNSISFEQKQKRKLLGLFKSFSYRAFDASQGFPLNLKELTSILHFPVTGTESPYLRQAKAGTAAVPSNMPTDGLLLGENIYRGKHTSVFIQPEDRMRHFYAIGQTGTGKTGLFKNMIIQDMRNGEGVCMIDPHGSDIEDVLANVPKERIDDVIYFDPAYTQRPMGLNMLEYNPAYPEQKTFVVDELLSIFKKLYSHMPESMGPAFEQYFRNATLLVMEDPESGNTLMDVSRVMVDAEFREHKLSKSTNPVVTQFWRDVATKAGGEASLQNIVPYITNKFDVFTANEIMRPIIGQQQSAFHMREVMDERKILLVNLSKGRLGDMNAHLIGLVLIGKILQAALSRVDMVGKEVPPPFYVYLDEFQNVTTPSISTILSEARKYQLSLNIAHQFIGQLSDDIKDAVFGNVGSLATFRVGAEDAEYLKPQFSPTFDTQDIMNLDNRNAYMKMLVNGVPTDPFSMKTMDRYEGNPEVAPKLKELSYFKYGRDKEEINAEIRRRYGY